MPCHINVLYYPRSNCCCTWKVCSSFAASQAGMALYLSEGGRALVTKSRFSWECRSSKGETGMSRACRDHTSITVHLREGCSRDSKQMGSYYSKTKLQEAASKNDLLFPATRHQAVPLVNTTDERCFSQPILQLLICPTSPAGGPLAVR